MARNPHHWFQAAVVGQLGPEAAARLIGSSMKCSGIHLPDDPRVSTLDGDARKLWDAAYENALDYYIGPSGDSSAKKTAEKTAWKTVRLFFRAPSSDEKSWRLEPALPAVGQGPMAVISDPGDLVDLGKCLEYTYIDGAAVLHIVRFATSDPPSLCWSQEHRSLFMFPRAQRTSCSAPDPLRGSSKMFHRWAQRDAACERVFEVPEVDVQMIGALDTIIYRSDKWHDRNPDPDLSDSQEYIHQVGDGVGLWQSAGAPPDAIVITGGCLDVEERGIIH